MVSRRKNHKQMTGHMISSPHLLLCFSARQRQSFWNRLYSFLSVIQMSKNLNILIQDVLNFNILLAKYQYFIRPSISRCRRLMRTSFIYISHTVYAHIVNIIKDSQQRLEIPGNSYFVSFFAESKSWFSACCNRNGLGKMFMTSRENLMLAKICTEAQVSNPLR